MSIKYFLEAVSQIGDGGISGNECIFADGTNNLSDNQVEPSQIQCISKGKQHVYAVYDSVDFKTQSNDFLQDYLSKTNGNRVRIKVQYALKQMLEEMQTISSGEEYDPSLAMIYVEGDYVYAGGYGESYIYHYSYEEDYVERISLVGTNGIGDINAQNELVTIEPVQTPHSKCIGKISNGDEYLVLGRELCETVTNNKILEIFAATSENILQVLTDEANKVSSSKTYNGIHVKIRKKRAFGFLAVILFLILAVCAGLLTLFGGINL